MNTVTLTKNLTSQMFRQRYAGTIGGYIWAILHPVSTMTVFYFVFAYGLRVTGPEGTTFIAWFLTGLVPWFLFQEAISLGTNSITQNSHMITKIGFPSQIVPLATVLSIALFNLVFWLFLFLVFLMEDIPLHINKLVFIKFYVLEVMLIIGIVYFTSSLRVFFSDMSEFISIVLNVLFWSTPIVWDEAIIPEAYQFLLYYNPIYFIIDGMREALIYETASTSHQLRFEFLYAILFSSILYFGFKFFMKTRQLFLEEL